MLTFVIGQCCPLQSSSILSSGNRSGTSATGGGTVRTDIFLQLHVVWSVTDLKFHGHPGNNGLTAVTSFSETRRNHKRPNWANKVGGRPQP